MTATLSAIWATTLRSWLIQIMAMSCSARWAAMSSTICAWIVTSSAVVGSSAMSRLGVQPKAMAIMTR